MAGHSNGCISAIAMATLNSDMVAAVGCHAGVAIAPFPDSYIPTPVLIVIGTSDLVVNYNGDETFLSSVSVHSLIASANGCTDSNENQVVNSSPLNNYMELTSSSCDNNATVVLVAVENVGHSPYLGYEESTSESVEEGTDVTTIDTTQMAWDFVKSHSLAVAPILVAPILVAPPVLDEDTDGVTSADTNQETDAESADTTDQQDKDAETTDQPAPEGNSSGASSAWNSFAVFLLFSVFIA